MKRFVLIAAGVVALSGCGGSNPKNAPPGPDPAQAMHALIVKDPKLAGKVTTLLDAGSWSVVQSVGAKDAHAIVFRLVGNKWIPDRSGRVQIEIVGPKPGTSAPARPQVAVQFASKTPIAASAIWVDAAQLSTKQQGSSRQGTIQGATSFDLKPGRHVAVGYARTDKSGNAIAWIFVVRH